MVSATSLGTALDKRYQIEIAAVNFSRNGQILTSAMLPSFDESIHQANKDLIKRKLTARVSPMTRETQEALDPSFHPLVATPKISHRSQVACNQKNLNVSSTPSVSRGKQRLAEKRKSSATNVIIPAKSGNTSVNTDTFRNTQDEPVSKRPRTILPRTMQVSEPETPKTPISPEPKLMSDNVATMSLLSASECHLAALQDEDGDTPLHLAIAHGNTQLVEYLINLMSCLTLDIYNNLKQTPLHLAVITGQAHIVGKLTTAGANVNLPDRNGQTPAHLACQRSSIECIGELFKGPNVVDLELRNFNGFTPLHQAVFASCPEAVKCLVDHGANVNCKDGKSGRTPLHHAVEANNMEVIQELLDCGANASEGAFSGNTPLQVASGRGMQNVRVLLESASGIIRPTSSKNKEITPVVPNYEDRRHVMVKSTYV